MTPTLRIAIVATVCTLALAAKPRPATSDRPRTVIEIEVKENRVDGCTSCGCRIPGETESGKRGEWWLAFGVVRPGAGGAWEAIAASSYCGSGPFKKVLPAFAQTVGTPYLIADLSLDGSSPDTAARLTIQTFTAFGSEGRPEYARRTEERRLSVRQDGDLALPLLVADAGAREAFGVHEVLLRLRTSALSPVARAYGSVAVSADVPGASILLDGGFVGRVTEGAPVLVGNVPAGDRELSVVDLSGREARRTVQVSEGQTAPASLSVLNLPAEARPDRLSRVGRNPQGYEEYWRGIDGVLVVRIPAGEFLMGSPEGRGLANERPQRRVHVSEFLIDKTEVTWRQMRRFHEATGQPLPKAPVSGTSDPYPVSFVLWDEAAAYCAWAGGRLPTEAEWEKAARGTDGREYPWGESFESDRCNTISGGLHQVEDVGSYPRCVSPYGVLDLAGGMWEWCSDWYADDSYARGPAADPRGPESGTQRVKRGGAWMSQPNWVRAAYRDKGVSTSPNVDHGFRCVQEVPAE